MTNIINNYPDKILSFSATIVIILTITLLMVPGCKKSEEEKKYTIGIVNPNPGDKLITQGFMDSMSKYGYTEGKNITYVVSQNSANMDADITGMAAKKVDLIFTVTTPAGRAAKKITEASKTPVVFVMYDPVESEVVKSMLDHGNTLTGIKIRGSAPKAVEWLLLIKPDIKNIFIPVAFDTKAAEQSIKDVKDFISGKKLRLTISEVKSDEELKKSLSSIPGDVDAIFIPHSIMVMSNMKTIIDRAIELKIPVVSSGHEEFKEGVLVTYGQNQLRTGEQASRLSHYILQGTPPSELPIETADFFLGINLKTAHAIGLSIPNKILQQADYIDR